MKKIVLSVLCLLCVGFLFGCVTKKVDPTLELDKLSIELKVDEEAIITATTTNTTEEVVWSSKNIDIATVENGKVTAVNVGETFVVAVCGELTKECKVVVKAPNVVGTLEVDYKSVSLDEGATLTLTATVNYKNEVVDGLSYSFKANSDVVTLKVNDNKCTITANHFGVTTIDIVTTHYGVELKETVTVEVKRNLSLEVDELELSEQGYLLALSTYVPTGKEDEYISEYQPSVKVISNEQELDNIEYVLTNKSQNNVIEIVDNKIKALSAGQANVEVKYVDIDETEYIVNIVVTVSRVEVVLDTKITLDKNVGYYEFDSNSFNGEVLSATIGDFDLEVVNEDNKVKVQGLNNLLVGEKELTIVTNKESVKIPVLVVTMVINTKEDLDNMGAVASTGNAVWDGYFILGSDIDYNDTFTTFCGLEQGGTWGGTTGFIGTFDGCGHTIKGFRTAAALGGLFGTIGSAGVVKNVGFIDAEVADSADRSGIVASFVYGTIENVFVDVNQNGAWWCGGVCEYAYSGANLRNIMVVVNKTNGRDTNFALTSFSFDDANIVNCYSIGSLGLYRNGGDSPVVVPNRDDAANYATFKDMADVKVDLSSFTGFWTINNNIPVFASFVDYQRVNADAVAITNDNSVKVVGTLEIVGDSAYTYSLKEEVAGITINGNIITIVENFGTTFTVVATNILDETIVVEKEFTVADKGTLALANYDIEVGTATTTLQVENLNNDIIKKIMVEGAEVLFTQDGNSITLSDYSTMQLGPKSVSIEGTISNYTATFTYVTKVIKTTEDWAIVAATTVGDALSGYYVLAANLDYTDKVVPTINTGLGWGAVFGFVGTFDGRGYKISNITLGGDQLGFFGTLGIAGVVKNVAFTSCEISWGGQTGIVSNLVYGTIENVYVDFASNGGWWTGALAGFIRSEATINNCIVNVQSSTVSDNRSMFGAIIQDSSKLTNCFGFGILEAGYEGSDAPGAAISGSTFKGFDTVETFKEASIDITSFDTNIWDTSSGVPTFILK